MSKFMSGFIHCYSTPRQHAYTTAMRLFLRSLSIAAEQILFHKLIYSTQLCMDPTLPENSPQTVKALWSMNAFIAAPCITYCYCIVDHHRHIIL